MTGGILSYIIGTWIDSTSQEYPFGESAWRGLSWRWTSGPHCAYKQLNAGQKGKIGAVLHSPRRGAFSWSPLFRQPAAQNTITRSGAGVGSLTAAFIEEMCSREDKPSSIDVTAYEVDSSLISHLKHTLAECERLCAAHLVRVRLHDSGGRFHQGRGGDDKGRLFAPPRLEFNCVIMNPP